MEVCVVWCARGDVGVGVVRVSASIFFWVDGGRMHVSEDVELSAGVIGYLVYSALRFLNACMHAQASDDSNPQQPIFVE